MCDLFSLFRFCSPALAVFCSIIWCPCAQGQPNLTSSLPADPATNPVRNIVVRPSTQKLSVRLQSCKLHLALQQQPLSAFLREIQKQAGILVIADDRPLMEAADLTFEGTLAEGLDQIADRFDYVWTVSPHGAILLHKRFRNAKDHSSLNLSEMRAITRDICAALDSPWYVPGEPGDTAHRLRLLYRSLTPEQIQQLTDGMPLRAAELFPQQTHFLCQTLYSLGFHDITEAWTVLAENLQGLPESKLSLGPMAPPYQQYRTLTLHFPGSGGQAKRRTLRYLSDTDWREEVEQKEVKQAQVEPSVSPNPASLLEKATINKEKPPLTSTETNRRNRGLPNTSAAESLVNSNDLSRKISLHLGMTSLREVARQLSQQTGIRIKPTAEIAEHTLVVEWENVSLDAALSALTDLNEWRRIRAQPGEITLARSRFDKPDTMEQISIAITKALTPALRRYLGIGVELEEWNSGDPAFAARRKYQQPNFMMSNLAAQRGFTEGAMGEPHVDSLWKERPAGWKEGGTYAFAQWTPAEHEKILLTLLGFTVGKMHQFSNTFAVLNQRMRVCQKNPQTTMLAIQQDRKDKPGMFGLYQEQINGFDRGAIVFAGNLPFLQRRPEGSEEEAREKRELNSAAGN